MKQIILGGVFSILFIIGFYYYIFLVLKQSKSLYLLKNISVAEVIEIIIIFISSVSITTLLLQRNQFIYFWDYSNYWIQVVQLSSSLFQDPYQALKFSWSTIGTNDYNWLMALLYALPIKVYGRDYTTAIVVVQIFYLCPAFILISIFINQLIEKYHAGKQSLVYYIAIVAFIPCIENVLLRGFYDAPVLMISTVLLIMAVNYDFKKFNIVNCFLISIGIMLLIVFRRHWAYWVIGFACMVLASAIVQIKKEGLFFIKQIIMTFTSIGTIIIVFLLGPFRKFLNYSLRDYSSIYVAWNYSIIQKLQNLSENVGFYIGFTIVLILVILVRKKKITIEPIIYCAFLIVIPTGLMSMTVMMHDSHFYLIIVPVISLMALSVNCFLYSCINNRFVFLFKFFVISILFLNFYCYAFYDYVKNVNNKLFRSVFLKGIHYSALYRNDIDTIKKLVDEINNLTQLYNTNAYICASSFRLNNHLLQLAYQPKTFTAMPRCFGTHDVDLRDGFNPHFFDAGIVVAEDFSPDYNDNYQKHIYGVIWFLSEELRNKESPIGRHYKIIKEYNIVDNSKAIIFKKISDYEQKDYTYLIDFYNKLYPKHKDLFSNRIIEYVKKIQSNQTK